MLHTDADEKQFIRTLLHSKAAQCAASTRVPASVFRNPQNRTVFEAIMAIVQSSRDVDLATVAQQLGVEGIMSLQNGYLSLVDLWEFAPSSDSVSMQIEALQSESCCDQTFNDL